MQRCILGEETEQRGHPWQEGQKVKEGQSIGSFEWQVRRSHYFLSS